MDVTTLFKNAWAEVSENLVGWILVYLVFGVLVSFTGGLAIVLMPNLHRELRDSRAQKRGPEIGNLFNFDNFADDAVNAVLLLAAVFIGSLALGIGSLVAALLLAFIMPLAADGRFQPMDNAKLSAKHVMDNVGSHLMMWVGYMVLGLLTSVTCGLFGLVAGPIQGMALQMFYEDSKPELDQLAQGMGLLTTNG